MCNKIAEAKILTKPDGTYPTAKEIWKYTPKGELLIILKAYKIALQIEKEEKI